MMPAHIEICNWGRFQHYKDRDPPWIKLYRDMLSAESWVLGTDTSRLVQVAIILLAARYNNEIPYRWALIRKVASLDCSEQQFDDAVRHLEQTEFLVIHGNIDSCHQDASTMIASCNTTNETLYPETEQSRAETEQRQKSMSRTNSDDIAAVFNHWRTTMGHAKARLDDKRKKLITAALKLGYTVDDLQRAITGYSHSPFHMGINDNGQRYDGLDLILRNAEKIDKGLQFHACPPKLMGKQARTEAINQQAVDEFLSGNVGFSFDDGPPPIDAEYETMTGGDHD